jgi:hypothetical protein
MENTEVNKELKTAISGVLDGIIEKGFTAKPAVLRRIVKANDHNQVLSSAGIKSVKKAYWEIIDEETSETGFEKLHQAEPYLNKGIALVSQAWAAQVAKPLTEAQIKEVKMPALNAEALEYRYNNDKESFSS